VGLLLPLMLLLLRVFCRLLQNDAPARGDAPARKECSSRRLYYSTHRPSPQIMSLPGDDGENDGDGDDRSWVDVEKGKRNRVPHALLSHAPPPASPPNFDPRLYAGDLLEDAFLAVAALQSIEEARIAAVEQGSLMASVKEFARMLDPKAIIHSPPPNGDCALTCYQEHMMQHRGGETVDQALLRQAMCANLPPGTEMELRGVPIDITGLESLSNLSAIDTVVFVFELGRLPEVKAVIRAAPSPVTAAAPPIPPMVLALVYARCTPGHFIRMAVHADVARRLVDKAEISLVIQAAASDEAEWAQALAATAEADAAASEVGGEALPAGGGGPACWGGPAHPRRRHGCPRRRSSSNCSNCSSSCAPHLRAPARV
jgi:hypothetical protein